MAKTIVVPDDHETKAGMASEDYDNLNTRLMSMQRHELDALASWNDVPHDASEGRDGIAASILEHALAGNEIKFESPDNWNRRSEGDEGVSPPDDKEPLPFESQADYQARQRALEQEAFRKEREERSGRSEGSGANLPAGTMANDPQREPGETDADYEERVREHRENDGSPAPLDEPEFGGGTPGQTNTTSEIRDPASGTVAAQGRDLNTARSNDPNRRR